MIFDWGYNIDIYCISFWGFVGISGVDYVVYFFVFKILGNIVCFINGCGKVIKKDICRCVICKVIRGNYNKFWYGKVFNG